MTIPTKELVCGNKIPVFGLGTWQMDEKTCLNAIPIALKLGYRAIDTAFAYYNEMFIAKALQGFPRKDLFLTSKLWRDFHDPKKVEIGCDKSLQDLKTDYLDLYLIHWPERINMIDILGQMLRLKEKGKVKSIGVCNATAAHINEIVRQGIQISVNQVEYHPFLNQKELLKVCTEHKIALTAYSPIIHGAAAQEQILIDIGRAHQKTASQVTLRWLIQKGLIVIPKASSEAHLKENIEIFDFELSAEEIEKIENIKTTKRTIVPDFNEFDFT